MLYVILQSVWFIWPGNIAYVGTEQVESAEIRN